MVKIRNKTTGEIIELGALGQPTAPVVETATVDTTQDLTPGGRFLQQVGERGGEAQERIAERGPIQEEVPALLKQPGILPKVQAGLTVLGAPIQAGVSAITNPLLQAQQGEFSPKVLGTEALKGLTLQKRGEFADVFETAGVDPLLSKAAGLFLNIAGPIKGAQTLNKMFGTVSKLSDKGILKASKGLVQASDDAVNAVGSKVGAAFSKVDDVGVEGTKFLDDVVKLPKAVLNKAEETFGNLDEFASNLTIGKVREFKRFLGKLRPSAFGKGERGVQETIDIQDLNKAYAGLKRLMNDTITTGAGKQTADTLMSLEKAYSNVVKSSNFIKKTVTEPTLRQATKGGAAASKLVKEGDPSFRLAVSTIKQASRKAGKSVNKAINLLDRFNRRKALLQGAGRLAQGVLRGSVIGATGGGVLSATRKMRGEGDE